MAEMLFHRIEILYEKDNQFHVLWWIFSKVLWLRLEKQKSLDFVQDCPYQMLTDLHLSSKIEVAF